MKKPQEEPRARGWVLENVSDPPRLCLEDPESLDIIKSSSDLRNVELFFSTRMIQSILCGDKFFHLSDGAVVDANDYWTLLCSFIHDKPFASFSTVKSCRFDSVFIPLDNDLLKTAHIGEQAYQEFKGENINVFPTRLCFFISSEERFRDQVESIRAAVEIFKLGYTEIHQRNGNPIGLDMRVISKWIHSLSFREQLQALEILSQEVDFVSPAIFSKRSAESVELTAHIIFNSLHKGIEHFQIY